MIVLNLVIGARVISQDGIPTASPWSSANTKKHKVWESVSPHLSINSQGYACYKEQTLNVSGHPCTVPTIRSAPVS